MTQHDKLDISPVPEEVLYINETGMADTSTYDLPIDYTDLDEEDKG